VFDNKYHNQLYPYLCSICQNYAQWWKIYTLTDVVGKQRDEQKQFSPLLDLMVQTIEQQREKREEEKEKEERKEKIERLAVVEGLRKYAPDHVLLVGRPGSGKSTALVRLLLEEAERGRDAETRGRGDAEMEREEERDVFRVPVLVELRYYQHSVLERVKAFLLKHQPNLNLDEEVLKQWLRQGQLLLLLDGFNELPSEEARQQVRVFRQDYPNTPMVFTTRDLGVGGDLNITKKLEMQPLTEAQMRQFVCAYLPQQGEQMLKQLGSRLREFGETPLLLWMLCSVFASNSNQIPANLGSVFRQFTEVYDKKIKQDILIDEEFRLWQRQLLQQLAWVMTQGETKTQLYVALPKQKAETALTEFLQKEAALSKNEALLWLDNLLKHNLIQLGTGNQIGFCHQLLQEYYTAEQLLERLASISDQQLKWDYLNYLKWTEPLALMLELLENREQAVRVVKLALEVDWLLGARLAGEVKGKFHKETVGLLVGLQLPRLFKVELVGVTKSDEAIPVLIKALEDANSFVRRSATEALGKIGSDTAIAALINALEHYDSYVRKIAAESLGKIGSYLAVYHLINTLEDSDYYVCNSAAEALEQIGSNAVVIELINALDNFDSYVRVKAIKTLGKIGSDAAVPALIKALEESDYYVRSSATEALGKIGSYFAVNTLINTLEDTEFHVCSMAAEALGKIGSDVAIPALIKALESSSSYVRINASKALGEIGSDVAVSTLINTLEDSDYYVRRSATEALGKIGSELAVTALIKALENSSYDVRSNASKALGEIGSEPELAVTALTKALENSSYDVRSNASKALGEIGSDVAVTAFISALEDSDSHVRRRAAESLKKIGSDAAIPQLIEKLQDHSFALTNGGDSLNQALTALETIQEHCQYYRPPPKLTMPKTLSHNYALLIGVGESANYPQWSLPVTVKDTLALKSLLTDPNLCGYSDDEQNLRLLNDAIATKESILSNLNWLQQQAAADSEATVLVYYSGHGWLDDATGKYYLIPHDVEPFDIPNSALPADTFTAALQQIPAQRLLVIIDSCHAAGMATAKNGQTQLKLPNNLIPTALPKNLIDELKQGTGRAVFTSSTGQQQSWIRPDDTMSIYTFHFLEALQGAGNQPEDQVVTVSHLMNYVGKTVPASAKELCQAEQTPFFDFATEDFPVALLHGGKGMPQQGWDEVKAEAQERISQISNVSVEGNQSQMNLSGGSTNININAAGDISNVGISS